MSTTKQVIVIRKDLGMRKGKMIAQGAHASMAFLSDAIRYYDDPWDSLALAKQLWLELKFTKICVYVNSEQELLDIYNKAKEANLTSYIIEDSGLTEFDGVPTYTAVAIGPDYNKNIDPITKDLPLL